MHNGVFTALLYHTSEGCVGGNLNEHHYINYDIRTGERLELNDIFSIGYFFEFTKILTQYWHNTHKQPYEYLFLYEENGMRGALIWDKIMEGKYDITRAKVCPVDNFILDEDGIIFVYQAMDIYGHICDDIYLKVKWKYAARWLNPEFCHNSNDILKICY